MRRHDGAGISGRTVRAAVEGLGSRGKTTRIPDPVRARVVAYARQERAAGQSWGRIARTVGLSVGALKNWSRTPLRARTLVPVEVAATATMAPTSIVVVSPGGYRVEGLDLATASALLRALG